MTSTLNWWEGGSKKKVAKCKGVPVIVTETELGCQIVHIRHISITPGRNAEFWSIKSRRDNDHVGYSSTWEIRDDEFFFSFLC